jgi:hypothetical protein
MHKIGADDKPYHAKMLTLHVCRKHAARLPSRTIPALCSARARFHFETLPASNELHGDSADSLCDGNLGLPTQMNNCED